VVGLNQPDHESIRETGGVRCLTVATDGLALSGGRISSRKVFNLWTWLSMQTLL